MAIISTRVDDLVKANAEIIADRIGISLSTAINVFLKRFTAENGFPFSVTVPKSERTTAIIDLEHLDASVKKAIADPHNVGLSHQFTYLDPNTNQLVTIDRKET